MFSRTSRIILRAGCHPNTHGHDSHIICKSRQCQRFTTSAHHHTLSHLKRPHNRLSLFDNLTLKRYISMTSMLHGHKHFEFSAGPFGNFVLNSTGHVKTDVRILDPQKHPLQNKVFIRLQNADGAEPEDDNVSVEQDQNDIRLVIKGAEESMPIAVLANIPIKFDISAVIKDDGSISIERFENESVNVQTENGGCRLKNIQTGTVKLESHDGEICCEGVIQGNSSIKTTGTGNVKVHRIQGLSFDVETDSGDIQAKALYADDSQITTSGGNVHIGACHRQCSVTAQNSGNISIDSLDGNLTAQTNDGDVSISYVARLENINISTNKGDIDLKLSDSLKTKVDLEATDLTLADDFAVVDSQENSKDGQTYLTGVLIGVGHVDDRNADLLGNKDRQLVAKTHKGTVSLSSADWFSSLKLMSHVD